VVIGLFRFTRMGTWGSMRKEKNASHNSLYREKKGKKEKIPEYGFDGREDLNAFLPTK